MAYIINKNSYEGLLHHIQSHGYETKDTYEVIGETIIFNNATPESLFETFMLKPKLTAFLKDCILNAAWGGKCGPYDARYYYDLCSKLRNVEWNIEDDGFETRRCIIRFPYEHCFNTIQFLVRENKVTVVCQMRSCNVVDNLLYDAFICSLLADRFILDMLPYKDFPNEVNILMQFGSLHLFKKDVQPST
jgi:hypothetical protein